MRRSEPSSHRRVHTPLVAAAALVGALSAWTTGPVRADVFAGDVPDRVWVDLGGAAYELDTEMSLSGEAGAGATIDFEEVFDLPGSKTTFQLMGTVRISEKRRWIDFGYVDLDRSGTRIIQEDIVFGDYVFQAGGDVTAQFGTRFIYAAFRYDFLHLEPIRISGSAGVSYVDLTSSLRADGSVTDAGGTPITGTFEHEASIGAPVPMIGIALDWALTRRLVLRQYNRLFRINVSALDGGLYQNGIRLNWYFAKHFGLGLGFDRTELDINEAEVNTDDVAQASYVVSGVGLYINLAF